MKVRYTAGRLSTEFEGNQTEIFAALAEFQEIFEETQCGKCQSESLRYVVREVDDNKYHELHCRDCRAKLAFGQHKKGNTLFPKRKDGDGNWLPDGGWVKWNSKAGKAE